MPQDTYPNTNAPNIDGDAGNGADAEEPTADQQTTSQQPNRKRANTQRKTRPLLNGKARRSKGKALAIVDPNNGSYAKRDQLEAKAIAKLKAAFGEDALSIDPVTRQVSFSGAPSAYSPALAAAIAYDIATGSTAKQAALAQGVSEDVIYQWRATRPEFSELLLRAREKQADHMSDQILEISDDATNDWIDRETASGRIVRVLDHEHVQRSRLRVDARFRLMEKLAPEKYGVKQQITVTREDERARYEALTPEQRMQEAEELIEQARRRIAMAEWTGGIGGKGPTSGGSS